jgi:hypothetical protein
MAALTRQSRALDTKLAGDGIGESLPLTERRIKRVDTSKDGVALLQHRWDNR